MSNLNLIATERDNQQYNIIDISNNLDWVLPNNIVNSTSSTPIKYKQYRYIKNLANSCIYNRLVSTQSGSVSGCSLLWEEIILINPYAKPENLIDINLDDSPLPRYYTPTDNLPYVYNIPTNHQVSKKSNHELLIIFLLIIFIISTCSIIYHYDKNKRNTNYNMDNENQFILGE